MKPAKNILYKGMGLSTEEMKHRSAEYLKIILQRRSVRNFSSESIPKEIIQDCLRAANSAPSGANMQPWHFVVAANKNIKHEIRTKAEVEEREFYSGRAPDEWLEALSPLGTDSNKEFLETAPYLVIIFERKFEKLPGGKIKKHYYTKESVGIATGFLITAIHNAGLVSLTHTPSPMNFLNGICNRPANEKPFLILAVGLPAEIANVPEIHKKEIDETATFI